MSEVQSRSVIGSYNADIYVRMFFNHDTAIKGLTERRPQNLRYEPKAGDIWTYFDAEGEGLVEWLIESIDGPQARLIKQTGTNIGYTATYELTKLKARRWKPKDLDAAHEVLWPCPDCGEDQPIQIGDYMCVQCREALDK